MNNREVLFYSISKLETFKFNDEYYDEIYFDALTKALNNIILECCHINGYYKFKDVLYKFIEKIENPSYSELQIEECTKELDEMLLYLNEKETYFSYLLITAYDSIYNRITYIIKSDEPLFRQYSNIDMTILNINKMLNTITDIRKKELDIANNRMKERIENQSKQREILNKELAEEDKRKYKEAQERAKRRVEQQAKYKLERENAYAISKISNLELNIYMSKHGCSGEEAKQAFIPWYIKYYAKKSLFESLSVIIKSEEHYNMSSKINPYHDEMTNAGIQWNDICFYKENISSSSHKINSGLCEGVTLSIDDYGIFGGCGYKKLGNAGGKYGISAIKL